MPIVTLTTDFGISDHFAGVMKGIILGICPAAAIIDISHEIQPFEITQGAFVISQSYSYFPQGTSHVVVVDPGVGTSRRPLLMEAAGQYFIAPDNGVLSMVYAREKHMVREITAQRFFRQPMSQTFHGRDVFAPAAAHLAAGRSPEQFGELIHDYVRLPLAHPEPNGEQTWTGTVLKVDRFGNLITNFHQEEFPNLSHRAFQMHLGSGMVIKLVDSYASAKPGEAVLIEGSSGYFEVVVNQASAAHLLQSRTGAPVELNIL